LKLIARVEVQKVSAVLPPQRFDHLRHDLEPSVRVTFAGVRAVERSRKGATVNIIRTNNCHSLEARESSNRQYL
jgi:hypothetical protein